MGGIYFLVFLGVGTVVLLSWLFSKAARLKRKLRAAPRCSIAQLPEDTLARVVGQAQVFQHTLTGPLTGRACVYYIALVEQQKSTGRSTYWKTLAREQQGVPFQLVDDTGHALVDPAIAEVALDFDGKSSSGTFHDADPTQEAFLARYGIQSTGWVFNKTLRFREAMIHVGETVAVLGQGVREPDPDAPPEEAYRGSPRTRLRFTGAAQFPLVISDDPSTTR